MSIPADHAKASRYQHSEEKLTIGGAPDDQVETVMRHRSQNAIQDAGSVAQTALSLGNPKHQEINTAFNGVGNRLSQNAETDHDFFNRVDPKRSDSLPEAFFRRLPDFTSCRQMSEKLDDFKSLSAGNDVRVVTFANAVADNVRDGL